MQGQEKQAKRQVMEKTKKKRGRPKKNEPKPVIRDKNEGLSPNKIMQGKRAKSSVDAGLQNKVRLLEYLADPRNPFLTRTELAKNVLGYTCLSSMYHHMTPDEFKDIELEAMDMRRAAYIDRLSRVDDALFLKAYDGDVAAIKLVYQRFEGWSEKKDYNIQQGISVNIVKFGDIEINNGSAENNKSSE